MSIMKPIGQELQELRLFKEVKRMNIVCPYCKKVMLDYWYIKHVDKFHPEKEGKTVTISVSLNKGKLELKTLKTR